MRGLPTGVQRKHSRRCPAYQDKTARCRGMGCAYQVQAGPRGARKTKTVATLDAAKTWKRDMDQATAEGRISRERSPMLKEAADRWYSDAEVGVALARGNRRFRAGTLSDYRRILDTHLLPELGAIRLDALAQTRLNEYAASLSREGKAASTVRNVLMPLRAILRHAVRMGWVASNPTRGMVVPAGSGRRKIVVEPNRIGAYLDALPVGDRALWGCAFYTGLRRGELRALRWAAVDLAGGVVEVDADSGSFDSRTKAMDAPKSEAGARKVPISAALRELLIEHRARVGTGGLVFCRGNLSVGHGRGYERAPFEPSAVTQAAREAFEAAGLTSVTLHDCRHTFASLMIAAMAAKGVFNPKLLQVVLGHSSLAQTYDRYGHLFPGQEVELGLMLDDFLSATDGNAGTVINVAPKPERAATVQRRAV